MLETRLTKRLHLTVLALVGLAGVFVVLVATSRYGLAVGPDSAAYISTARSLADRQGFRSYYDPFAAWPPLLPLLLVGPVSADMAPQMVAVWPNAIAFGLTVMVIGAWVRSATGRLSLALIGQLLVIQAEPILHYDWLMTEPLFLTLTTLLLWRLAAATSRRTWPNVLAVAVLASLAWLTRYTGIAAVATGGLVLLVTGKVPWRRRLGQTTVFATVTGVPMAMWLIRNQELVGAAFGHRPHAHGVFWQNISYAAGIIARWAWPAGGLEHLSPHLLASLLTTGFILGAAWLIKLLWQGRSRETPTNESILMLYVLAYLAFLLWSTSRYVNEQIGDRYCCPIYPALVILAMLALDRLARAARACRSRWGAARLGLAAGGAWMARILAIGLTQLPVTLTHQVRDGAGAFSTTLWRESDIGRGLLADPLPPGPVLSNEPHAVYILLGRVAQSIPRWELGVVVKPAGYPKVVAKWTASVRAQPRYLIIWDQASYDNLVPLAELRRFWRFKTVRRFIDGTVYFVSIREKELPGPMTQPDE